MDKLLQHWRMFSFVLAVITFDGIHCCQQYRNRVFLHRTPSSTDENNDNDNLSLFLPTICSNQDLVKTLVERNPEEFRYLAQTLAFLILPEDLNIEAINLTQLCLTEDVNTNPENSLIVNGFEPSCKSKACGEPCTLNEDVGVCDGIGHCRHVMENPCAIHGCDVKKCGDTCITGDMQGWCNIDGKCDPFDEKPICAPDGKKFKLLKKKIKNMESEIAMMSEKVGNLKKVESEIAKMSEKVEDLEKLESEIRKMSEKVGDLEKHTTDRKNFILMT